MTLLGEICQLADRHADAPEAQRVILKMAISLLDQLDDPRRARPRRVIFSIAEYERVPGRWELSDGQLKSY